MKALNIVLLGFSVLLTVIVLALVSGQVSVLREYHDQLEQLRPVSETQPYGGCKEAARYPNTPGYVWCRDRGYLD